MRVNVNGFERPVRGISDASSSILAAIACAAIATARTIREGQLRPPSRDVVSERNVHGEVVHRLDRFATERFRTALAASGVVLGLAAEELDEPVYFDIDHDDGSPSFLCVLDPIDGTSNADVAITIGSIFGVLLAHDTHGTQRGEEPFLRPASDLVACGYVLYGSATVLVLATDLGVDEFTLDDATGVFCLTRENMRFPDECPHYSVNYGYETKWSPKVRTAVRDAARGRSLRYVGSMVADFHRDLSRGGVFLYPPEDGRSTGKIRLLYEAGILAFIADRAGGYASTGEGPVLTVRPAAVHQTTPFFVGNATVVRNIERTISKRD